MTRAIAIHAVQTAVDAIYRDTILLQDSIEGNMKLLAARMTRMHWYPQYWSKVKFRYNALAQEQLIDRMDQYSDLFRDLITMAQVPT